jgi:ketol-acid reductoisomerase
METEALAGKTVAILGFGNQGRAHALNLRDSGVSVIVGTDPDRSGSARASADGFTVRTMVEAASSADLVVMALPDRMHGEIWNCQIATAVKPSCVIGFLHGFSVHYRLLEPADCLGVVMVAPKGPGTALRERYVRGQGLPCLLAVHQPGLDPHVTHGMATAWAHAIGCSRAAIIPTTFAAETETDLFGEQAVLCGGMLGLVQVAFETLVRAGYPAELAYMECAQELKQVADLLFAHGPQGMRAAISDTAEYGAFEAADRIGGVTMRAELDRVLEDIRSGDFARRLMQDAQSGSPWLRSRRASAANDPIEAAGAAVREWMPWLKGDAR